MPRSASPIRSAFAALSLGALMVLTAACGSTSAAKPPTADDTTTTSPSPSKRTTTTSSTSEVLASKRADVVASYRAAYKALAVASGDPSAPHESLSSHFEGESLTYVMEELDRLATAGTRVTYPAGEPPVPAVTAVELSDQDEAHVTVCLIDNGVRVSTTTGEVVDDLVLSRATRATLHFSSEGWKLSSAESAGDWNDGNGCDR